MFFRIKNLFEQGGIEIITPSVARTVIQPDGDVIMFVNKKMFGNPQALQKHFNKITRLLSTLNVFRKFFRWFTTIIGPVGIGYSIADTEDLYFNNSIFYTLIGSGIVFLIGFITFYVLKQKLKRVFMT